MRAIVSIFIDANLYDAKETGIINFQPDATNLYRELKPKIINNHETYAKNVNADYCLFQDSKMWSRYLQKIRWYLLRIWGKKEYPQGWIKQKDNHQRDDLQKTSFQSLLI